MGLCVRNKYSFENLVRLSFNYPFGSRSRDLGLVVAECLDRKLIGKGAVRELVCIGAKGELGFQIGAVEDLEAKLKEKRWSLADRGACCCRLNSG